MDRLDEQEPFIYGNYRVKPTISSSSKNVLFLLFMLAVICAIFMFIEFYSLKDNTKTFDYKLDKQIVPIVNRTIPYRGFNMSNVLYSSFSCISIPQDPGCSNDKLGMAGTSSLATLVCDAIKILTIYCYYN